MVGIEGNVVGKVGNGVAGSGGRVTLGAVGMVGNVGFGKDGIWVLGSGGNVGLGRVGREVVGNGGNVDLGSVGMEDNGGNVDLGIGRDGNVGNAGAGVVVCKRCRAAPLIWMLDKHNSATIIDNREQCLKPAILVETYSTLAPDRNIQLVVQYMLYKQELACVSCLIRRNEGYTYL
ncbi:hypothetical protein M0R45_004934 [Rubus argutus]|uniref:Uncharacterized protein n=1 Tax=Rubus argutus TaxID=59490 RepID=A0AAW1YL24_RUBAR